MSAGVSVPFGLTPHAPRPPGASPYLGSARSSWDRRFPAPGGSSILRVWIPRYWGRTTSSYVYKYTCAPMHLSFYLLRSGLIPLRWGGEVD